MSHRTLSPEQAADTAKLRGITPRAFVTGLTLVTFLCIVTPYTDLVMQTSLIACNHFPIGAVTLLLLLVALVNRVLRMARILRPFDSAELITIYVMMLIGAGVPSFGLMSYVLPVISSPRYYGPLEGWLGDISQYIPNWFGPVDQFAVDRYYEGLKPGETIPWGAWIGPLAAWSILVFALYLVIFCLCSILRKQWVERERLSFPLVQLPLEMTRGEDNPDGNPFFRNKLLWVGIAIPVIVHSVNSLQLYIPQIPSVNIKKVELTTGLLGLAPWSALHPIYLYVYFSVIGVAYLLSSEIGLSLWLFYFIYRLQNVAVVALGYGDTWGTATTGDEYATYQGTGAILAIVAGSTWMARKHLAEVFRQAFDRSGQGTDADEPLSPRFALVGLATGTLVLTLWLQAAGMSALVALVFLLLFYAMMIAVAKFVADSGLLMVQTPLPPGDLMTSAVGTAGMGSPNIAILNIWQWIFALDLRSTLLPSAMDGFRMADGPGIRRRSLVKAMAAALVVAVVVSCVSHLVWTYKVGGINMHCWFFEDSARLPYIRAVDQIRNAVPTSFDNIGFTVLGAGVTSAMAVARQRFACWPLHPIGYALGSTFVVSQMWFPILVGWLLKTLTLRYGGRRLYMLCMPAFLGLIIGEFGVSSLWILIDLVFGVRGHAIFPN